jgi:hypothetical protein
VWSLRRIPLDGIKFHIDRFDHGLVALPYVRITGGLATGLRVFIALTDQFLSTEVMTRIAAAMTMTTTTTTVVHDAFALEIVQRGAFFMFPSLPYGTSFRCFSLDLVLTKMQLPFLLVLPNIGANSVLSRF